MNIGQALTRMVEDAAQSPALALERRIERVMAETAPEYRDRLMLVYDARRPDLPPTIASSLIPLEPRPWPYTSPEAFIADARLARPGSVFPTWVMPLMRDGDPVQPPVRCLIDGVDDPIRSAL